jgi:predicted metalloprotease
MTERAVSFNEGMQIDTSTTSSSGGGGGRGIAIGGGLGGLVFVVVAMLLGVDPGKVISQQPQMNTQNDVAPGFDLSQCRTGADANKFVQCRVVATGNSVDAVWQQLMPGYTRPRVRLFKGEVDTGCGAATSDVGPFYCPVDKTAYFDTDFFQVLVDQFGSSGGPFAQEYVVAHEFGHHVQDIEGTLGRAQQGAKGAGGNGVRTELQADCYAGVWAHYASTTKQANTGVPFLEPLSDKDISDALSAAASVGDDRIQKQATGRTHPESWTHGSSEQRQHWFTVGYQSGEPDQCDTFNAPDLG